MRQFFPIRPNWQYFTYTYALFAAGFFFLTRSKYHNLFYYLMLLTPYIVVFSTHRFRALFESTIFKLAAAYLLMVAVSVLWGSPPEPRELSKYLFHFLYLTAFIALTIELSLHSRDFLDKTLKAILISAAFWAPVAIALFYQDAEWSERLSGVGRLVNPVSGSTVYGMVALICFYMYIEHDEFTTKWRNFALAVGALCIAYMILTQTRGTVIGLFLALLLYTLFSHHWKIALTVIAAGATLGFLFFVGIFPPELVLARGMSYRPEIWSIALTYILDNPWIGHGAEFGVAYEVSKNVTINSHTHNAFINSLLYVGIAGTILLLMAIAQSLRYTRTSNNRLAFMLLVYAIIDLSLNGYKLLDHPQVGWLYFWFPIALAAASELRQKLPQH